MTSRGQHFVMVRQTHQLYVCLQRLPTLLDQSQSLLTGIFYRCQDHFMMFKQIRPGGFYTTFFRAGNRMPRYKIGWHLAKHLCHGFNHGAFGAADISDHCALQRQRRELLQHRMHSHDRHRQHD